MSEVDSTTCCIVGGGPAGVFLGYLLARSGVRVTIVEKHADFLRDFRGDTIHPSTMTLLDELGLLEEFLPLVDFRTSQPWICLEGQRFPGPDVSHLNVVCPYVGFVPQWDFLNFLTEKGEELPGFELRMSTRAINVMREEGRVVGVKCETEAGTYDIRADLVVAADGRSSTIRDVTNHVVEEQGIPIDVLWFRLDRPANDDGHTLAWLKDGHMLVTIPRRDHYQVAMIIQKDAFPVVQRQGLESFRQTIARVCPVLGAVASRLQTWDDVKLLTVQINYLPRWHEPGLLFIGDAAHAMSPVGGVGINLAIQDAVATANGLAGPLLSGNVSESDLSAVQQRREPAARRTQRLQSLIHNNLFGRGRGPGQPFSPPWYLRLMIRLAAPLLRRQVGRWIGIGFQPEHVQSSTTPMKGP